MFGITAAAGISVAGRTRSHYFIYACGAVLPLRHSAGGIPTALLNALLNAASDSYPASAATLAIVAPPSMSRDAANCRRQR